MRFSRMQNVALALSLFVAAGALTTGLTPAAYGQTIVSGDVTGHVADSTGAVVVGATVTLSNDADGSKRTEKTSADGGFRFSLLSPGTYSVKVTSAGLVGAVKGIVVSVGKASTISIVAKPASVATEVLVDSDSQPLLQTEDANITTTLDAKEIEDLPVPGGDISTLAFTAPGVNLSTGGGYGGFVAFGLPATANLYTLNGNDIMDPYLNLNNSGSSNLTLGSNEIADVAIVNNGYNAQYGRYPGTQINYTTKFGANAFHGNLQHFWNGAIFNANDWVNKNQGNDRPHAVSNQWAGSLGGPIIKDKLFFFFDTEGMRYVLPGTSQVKIPTSSFLSNVVANVNSLNPSDKSYYQTIQSLYNGAHGASGAAPVAISAFAYDPKDYSYSKSNCGKLDGWSVATAGAINTALGAGTVTAQPTVNGVAYGYTYTGYTLNASGKPVPTSANSGATCTGTFNPMVNNINTEALWSSRADYVISSKDHVSARAHHDWGVQATSTDPINTAFSANSIQPEWEGQVSETHVFNNSLANNLIISGMYYKAIFGPPDFAGATKVFPTTLRFVDGLSFANLGGNDYGYPSGRNVQQLQLVDDISWQYKRHSIKFGLNYRWDKISDYTSQAGQTGYTRFYSLADFAAGQVTASDKVYLNFPTVGQQPEVDPTFGVYVQDEWAVSDKLKLTLSARVDHNANFWCPKNCFSHLTAQFSEIAHTASIPYNQSIQTGQANPFLSTQAIVFEPRFGFAYAPAGVGGRFNIRGGAGMFSDAPAGTLARRFLGNAPNTVNFLYRGSALVDPTLATGNPTAYNYLKISNTAFQTGFKAGQTLAQIQAAATTAGGPFSTPTYYSAVDKFKTPKTAEWNLELQAQISRNDVLDFNYVGNYSWDTILINSLGNAYDAGGFGGLPTTAPDSRFGIVNDYTNNGHANYNGLTTSIRHQAKYGVTLSANYTYSHALDLVSNGGLEYFNGTQTYPQEQLAVGSSSKLNYGDADYDLRHSVSFQYVWKVPFKSSNVLLKNGLEGWAVSGNLFYRSGYPISVINSNISPGNTPDTAFLASVQGAKDRTCATKPNAKDYTSKVCYAKNGFIDSSDPANAKYGFGNVGRNAFLTPHYFNTDLQLNKETKIFEKVSFKIGANFYNILNHANFAPPVNDYQAGDFGAIESTVTPPSSPYGSFQGAAVSGRVVQILSSFTF